jgi:hypothetical protein
MIDLKLDVLPVEQEGDFKDRHVQPGSTVLRKGLSIDETIAHDADHSVGATGVETAGGPEGGEEEEAAKD